MEAVTVREQCQTAIEIKAAVQIIQEVMKGVMKDGIHYGKLPGCGDKPTLLKPGAEKILSTFRIAVEPVVTDLSGPDECRYRVEARATAMADGRYLGSGVGEASSSEEKYRWRRAVCKEEFDSTPEDRRRDKWLRDGSKIPQIRTAPADVANTVLKMGVKRAIVAVTLQVTAASDIFAQDLEDLPEGLADQAPAREPIKPPQARNPAPPESDKPAFENPTMQGVVKNVSAKPGEKNGKKFVKYGVCLVCSDGEIWANTFDKKIYEAAEGLKGHFVDLEYKKSQYGIDALGISIAVETAKDAPTDATLPEAPAEGGEEFPF